MTDTPRIGDFVATSTLTCPACGAAHAQTMPTDACQWFWACPSCRTVARPKPGDCCVFCSYGTVACPPIQLGGACCGRARAETSRRG